MILRGQNFKQEPLNIVGSSIYGRYPKISTERTLNMFISDEFLVPYSGYQLAIPANQLGNGAGLSANVGRGAFTSTKLNKIVAVFDNNLFLIEITFNQELLIVTAFNVQFIGNLLTSTGVVYITENNKPQIVISDGVMVYYYDPTISATLQQVQGMNFVPGKIDFHDTYILCAASQDLTYTPPANNTWRLGIIDGSTGRLTFPSDAQHVGLLETKPDQTQAVIRFPSKGNMIFVFGKVVTEAWFDTGSQLFPYQRNNQFNVDYGCLNPATIAATDEMVVWLAANEKSGPVIMWSDGGLPEKITTDGIDYLFSTFQNPGDSRGFLYRQDGHLIYHINFYTDNYSLFYDFNTKKFFNACDNNYNYYIGENVVFYNNQYYFITRNNGNLYAFDTAFTTYDGAMIPRMRICRNIRSPDQQYKIINDIGFTIETGETNYYFQNTVPTGFINSTPRVDLAMSYDGGASFGDDFGYSLNAIGQRKNRLMWWQLGAANDGVPRFKFWSFGRIVCTDGVVSLRQ